MSDTYAPPPVAAESSEICALMSTSVWRTDVRYAERFPLTAPVMRPVPLLTAKLDAAPDRLHAPPFTAVPSPLETVRSNVSAAYRSVMLTEPVVDAVPPRLSTTLSVIG